MLTLDTTGMFFFKFEEQRTFDILKVIFSKFRTMEIGDISQHSTFVAVVL